ncbi:MAG: AMP-binding protein [Streptosporangiales bacterium]|nr:AMP-binding protein [Streptosporangiales bacterium]
MDIGRALSWTAERFPERVGIAGTQRLTYRQWDARTNQIARALLDAGVRRGSRVALLLSNSEVLASTHLACQKLGATSTPLNIRLAANELSYCLGDSTPTVVVTDDSTAALAGEILPAAEGAVVWHAGDDAPAGALGYEPVVAQQPDGALDLAVGDEDASVMLYTSGTTGRPKGVPRTQRNEFSASVAHVMQTGTRSAEVTLGAMPMYHTMGLRSLLSTVVVGGTFVEIPRFTPARGIELIAQEQVTSLYLVPTAFWSLDDTGELATAGSKVSRLAYAGAAMTSTLATRLNETVRPEVFVNHYGSSEVYTFSIEERAGEKPGSAGRPGMFSRLRLASVDDGESSVAPGLTGEILASLASDEAFAGYWHRPDADEKSLRGGWYHTGDLGVIDEEGDLWVVGRVDDMIVTGGENVHPVEVEDVLTRSADVAECAVVGLPDEKWGQAVTAFVVFRDRSDDDAAIGRLEQWLRNDSGISDYKRPKRIVAIDEVPKNPVGKILRRKLTDG